MSNYKKGRIFNRNGEKGKGGREKQGNLSIPFLFRLLRLRVFYVMF
jgi:hypothetical protein